MEPGTLTSAQGAQGVRGCRWGMLDPAWADPLMAGALARIALYPAGWLGRGLAAWVM